MHHPTDRITYTMAFVTPVVDHWLEREIAQWVDDTVAKSSANGLVGTGFVSRYMLQTEAGFF